MPSTPASSINYLSVSSILLSNSTSRATHSHHRHGSSHRIRQNGAIISEKGQCNRVLHNQNHLDDKILSITYKSAKRTQAWAYVGSSHATAGTISTISESVRSIGDTLTASALGFGKIRIFDEKTRRRAQLRNQNCLIIPVLLLVSAKSSRGYWIQW